MCVCACHIVCVNIELAPGKTWISLSSPRAWLSHVATDSGCGLLARLSIIECYCAAVQFPATPLHAIRQVRLACHPSFSVTAASGYICFASPIGVYGGLMLTEQHWAVILQTSADLTMPFQTYLPGSDRLLVTNDERMKLNPRREI